jgi:hypothetical protein
VPYGDRQDARLEPKYMQYKYSQASSMMVPIGRAPLKGLTCSCRLWHALSESCYHRR